MATSLKDMLENGESSLSYNGNTPPINPQAVIGNPTSIHSTGFANESYSLNGTNANTAQDIWNAYNDGDFANPLPAPSQLDIANGYTPGQYTSNTPEGVSVPTL
jgi:hypothetical protein